MKRKLAIIACAFVFIVSGCGADTANETETTAVQGKSQIEEADENSIGDTDTPGNNDTDESDTGEYNDASEKETNVSENQSLAKRLCGRYSYHNVTSSGEEVYHTINMISFGDNLYAFCAEAIPDDNYENLDVYSFWVSEFIPLDAEDMKGTDNDSVKVNELRFSIMSNAGMYWDSGCEGTITYTADGPVFEGFSGDGFLCPTDDSRLFLADERVERVFSYLGKEGRRGDKELQGLWSTDVNGAPLYLDFKEADLFIYQKRPDAKVVYAAGECDFADGYFTCMSSMLGNGGMPFDFMADYEIDGDDLVVTLDSDFGSELSGKHTFRRTDEADIHVISMDEVKFNEESFGPFGGGNVSDMEPFELPTGSYYGAFVTAQKDANKCLDVLDKLSEAGIDAQVLYTPDFAGLNPEPYYVVATRLYENEANVKELLDQIKAVGFSDAYIKETGAYIGKKFSYTMSGSEEIDISGDRIYLRGVAVSVPYWTSQEYSYVTLYIDKNSTRFAPDAELSGFANLEKGDTPYMWFTRNYEYLNNNADAYIANGPALLGVFEVGLDGNRITDYYGSYWWD